MDLLVELVKLATALVVLATAIKKGHSEIADDDHATDEAGRES